jgi:hypothetical protein
VVAALFASKEIGDVFPNCGSRVSWRKHTGTDVDYFCVDEVDTTTVLGHTYSHGVEELPHSTRETTDPVRVT